MTAPAIGVCGFGRCGSSMVMAMLDAGGVPPVAGSQSHSYELVGTDLLARLPADAVAGRAVKLLDGILHDRLRDDVDWRFVWLSRNRVEQATSLVKFLRGIAGVTLRDSDAWSFAAGFRRDEPRAQRLLARRGDVLTLNYEDALAAPRLFAERLGWFAGGRDFDVDAAAAVVHRRSPNCAPDLTFEFTGAAP